MNPAILVLSHPNNEERETIVKEFGNFIKQFNFPTYLFTNFPTSKPTEFEYDGSFFHNYNPPQLRAHSVLHKMRPIFISCIF